MGSVLDMIRELMTEANYKVETCFVSNRRQLKQKIVDGAKNFSTGLSSVRGQVLVLDEKGGTLLNIRGKSFLAPDVKIPFGTMCHAKYAVIINRYMTLAGRATVAKVYSVA